VLALPEAGKQRLTSSVSPFPGTTLLHAMFDFCTESFQPLVKVKWDIGCFHNEASLLRQAAGALIDKSSQNIACLNGGPSLRTVVMLHG
jgi:hypothetical protein